MDPGRRFPQALRLWRRGAGLSQAELDALLGRTAGTVAQIEVGRLKPPDRALCQGIATALSVPFADVWRLARDERLRLADAEAFEDYKAERAAGVAEIPFSAQEVDLLRQLRALDRNEDYDPGTLARMLGRVVTPLVADAEAAEGPRARLAGRVVWALARVAALPTARVRRLLVVLIKTVEALVDETAPTDEL